MAETVKKICRYFNTSQGCWFGDQCNYLHIPDMKPPCEFFSSSLGCRFGDACHFSHEKSMIKSNKDLTSTDQVNINFSTYPTELCGTNNNNSAKDSNPVHSQELDFYLNEVIRMKRNHEERATSMKDKKCVINEPNPSLNMSTKKNLKYINEENSNANNINNTNSLNNNACEAALDGNCHFIQCGSCAESFKFEQKMNQSVSLKNHYLDNFLNKESEHIKYVKTKAEFEVGQLYWCKMCMLIFEKPWSLFQHMADKAKGIKVLIRERKYHIDWIDNVAYLMAGFDLGLFSQNKLKIDLNQLLTSQFPMNDELETANLMTAMMLSSMFSNPINDLLLPTPYSSSASSPAAMAAAAAAAAAMSPFQTRQMQLPMLPMPYNYPHLMKKTQYYYLKNYYKTCHNINNNNISSSNNIYNNNNNIGNNNNKFTTLLNNQTKKYLNSTKFNPNDDLGSYSANPNSSNTPFSSNTFRPASIKQESNAEYSESDQIKDRSECSEKSIDLVKQTKAISDSSLNLIGMNLKKTIPSTETRSDQKLFVCLKNSISFSDLNSIDLNGSQQAIFCQSDNNSVG